MMRRVALACAILLPVVVAAQAPKPLSFEVASVRLSDQKTPPVRRFTPGRVELVNVSLDEVVQTAFDIKLRNRMVVPGWLQTVRVEIRAASPLTAPAQVREMLRTLLVERFGMVTHTEQRPFDVHELTVGSGGHKMREVEAVDDLAKEFTDASRVGSTSDRMADTIEGPRRSMALSTPGMRTVTSRTMYETTFSESGAVRLNAVRMSMRELASQLMLSVGAEQVFDRTGLTGLYQFTIDLPNNPLPFALPTRDGSVREPSSISAAKAVESLGLRLERRRAPVDVVVVDRIERTPKEN
jgi:uncharacterized protein (TIGR03435 family)